MVVDHEHADLRRVNRPHTAQAEPQESGRATRLVLDELEQARRGAVVWIVSGTSDRLTRVMEFVRDHGCTPLPLTPEDASPAGPTPLLAVLANAPDAEAQT